MEKLSLIFQVYYKKINLEIKKLKISNQESKNMMNKKEKIWDFIIFLEQFIDPISTGNNNNTIRRRTNRKKSMNTLKLQLNNNSSKSNINVNNRQTFKKK